MKVLLLSMPDSAPHFNANRWKPPSLALTSIAGNLEGHDVYIADLILRRQTIKASVLELLDQYKPDIVGISAMSFQFASAGKTAEIIKAAAPDIKTVLGGYHATVMFDELCKADDGAAPDLPFDFLLRGEGDLSFGELLDAIEGKRKMESVNGLSFRTTNGFVNNPPRVNEDLDKIKLPDRSKRIWSGYHYYGFKLDLVETSRGCVMPCTFCSIEKMYGRSFRKYDISRVIEDIGNAKNHGADFIIITDDNFTLDLKRFEALCEAICEAGHNDIRYIIQASSAGIASSDTVVEKMAKAGFRIVFLGIENVSKENLKQMKKGDILEKTKIAIKKLHDRDIMIVGGMIIGHPDDNEESIAENYAFFVKNNIDFFADQILTPYPKTGMRADMIEKGLVTNLDDFSKYNCFWANVKTNRLSPDDLQFLRWKYNRKYRNYICTTPAFIKNYPLAYYSRAYVLRPYYRIKNFIVERGMTQRDLYERDMERAVEMNRFFD